MSERHQRAQATVAVLTAEVRALMVGSRQVTLSVYRQLDVVPYDEVEPMGRVNDKGAAGRWIVGRGPDGTLVRANWDWAMPVWTTGDEQELQSLQRKKTQAAPGWPFTEEDAVRLARWIRDKEQTPTWRAEYEAKLAAYRALPLIVLAGLR